MLFTSTVLTLAAYYKGLAPTSASAWGSAITTRAFHSTPRLSGLTGALSGGFSTQFDNVINKDTMRIKYTHYLYHTHIIYHINKNVAYKVWGSQYIIYAQFVAIKNYDKPFGVQNPSFILYFGPPAVEATKDILVEVLPAGGRCGARKAFIRA